MRRWSWLLPTVAACGTMRAAGPAATPPAVASSPAAAVGARVAEPPEPTPHADYAELRPFRNYYRVVRVGDYLAHYRAYYVSVELVRGYYVAAPDGSGLRFEGYDFGLATGPFADDYPPAQAATAAAIRDEIHRRAGARTHIEAVTYVGTYREVVVEEIVPRDEPGDPARRSAASQRLTLAADEALTGIEGRGDAVDTGSPDNVLCRRPVRDCGPAPHWLDARADREGLGRLWEIEDPSSEVPPAVRDAFERAVAAAAARVVAGTPPTPLAELAVQRLAPEALLPDDLDDRIWLGLDADLSTPRATPSRLQSHVLLPLSLGRALAGGGTRGTAEYFFGGRTLSLAASLVANAPAGASPGRGELELQLDYWLRDGAHPIQHGVTTLRVPVLIDGPRVMPLAPPRYSTEARGGLPFHASIPYGQGESLEITVQLRGGR